MILSGASVARGKVEGDGAAIAVPIKQRAINVSGVQHPRQPVTRLLGEERSLWNAVQRRAVALYVKERGHEPPALG